MAPLKRARKFHVKKKIFHVKRRRNVGWEKMLFSSSVPQNYQNYGVRFLTGPALPQGYIPYKRRIIAPHQFNYQHMAPRGYSKLDRLKADEYQERKYQKAKFKVLASAVGGTWGPLLEALIERIVPD